MWSVGGGRGGGGLGREGVVGRWGGEGVVGGGEGVLGGKVITSHTV